MDDNIEMDQELAKTLLLEGASFVFLDVPEGTEFGIDMKIWNTGELFRGVKMIPPGIHFIHYSSVSNTNDLAPRQGFFYNFRKSEFVVKKWNKTIENISDEVVPANEIVSLKQNLLQLDKFLGPYPYQTLERWVNLSSHINERLVEKLMPLSGQIRSALDLVSCSDENRPRGIINAPSSSRSPSNYKQTYFDIVEENLLPDLKPVAGTALRFTAFPEQNYPDDATPSQITQHCLDSTYVLDTLILSHSSPIDIIGEMEFAFICFLVGHSLEAFEHWKKLVGIFCSCELALRKYYSIYDQFISLLEIQIVEIPEEFLADIVANNNFVYVKLKQLFKTVLTSNIDGILKMKIDRFKRSLTDIYGWEFKHLDRDDDDEAPVIVYLDE